MKRMLFSISVIAALVFVVIQIQKPDTPVVELPTPDVVAAAENVAETPGPKDMTDVERLAFRSEVRAYLLDNPEVLMEAIQVLENRQQQDQAAGDDALVAANIDEINSDGFSYVGGNPEGDVTLVEFLDYRCGFCRRAHDELTKLLEADPNIRLIVKEFPILGEQSTLSARLAVATLHQAGPEAYHALGDFLITFNGNLTEKTMAAVLEKQGLNSAAIIAYMDDPAVAGHIASVNGLAGKLQITGTPTFVLGGEMIRGYVPLANMQEMVAYFRAAEQ
ncbi:MAG: protein-disulfide isomerase [Paracoccaceae bacterium]|jgi:protein-disulfide isomerase